MLIKNTASQKWKVFAFSVTTGLPVTGDASNITANIDKDYAGVAAVTDTNPTESEDGYYVFDLTQAETNADILDIYPESATSNVVVLGAPANLHTRLEGVGGRLAVDAVGISGSTSAADNVEANIGNLDDAITDVMSRIGAPVGASISADIAAVKAETVLIVGDTNELQTDWADGGRLDLIQDAVLADTAVIGALGAGLTGIPWNAAWDTEVQSEVNDALVALNLDHLLAVAVVGGDVVDNSVFAQLVSKEATADWDDYNNTTESFQALKDLGDTNWTTATTVNLNADQSSVTIGTTTAVSNGVTLATSEDIYWAHVQWIDDDGSSTDEYTVTWFLNGARITSGITSPTIQVVKRVDGTDLVSSTAMTQIGSTGSYKYDEATNRIPDGESYLVVVGATIDSGSRAFSMIVGRDTTT